MNQVLLFGFMLIVLFTTSSLACNKHVCASLVSKCLLLKSCECDMSDKKNCTCCRQCHKCLARLYTECCSCVGKYTASTCSTVLLESIFDCNLATARKLQSCQTQSPAFHTQYNSCLTLMLLVKTL